MKKKQYFGNEKGALSGIFVAFAAIALIPLCFVIFNYFWANTGSESKRQNDNMYGSNTIRLGTAQEVADNLDAALPTVSHCVADFAVRDGNGVDSVAIPLIDAAPVNCIDPDAANARTKIRQVAGTDDPSSIGPYRVIKPNPKSGNQDFYVLEKYSRGENTEGGPADDTPPAACFTGDTIVAVDIEDGSYIGVPIKYLREGDTVLGANDDSEIAALLASPGLVRGEKENLLSMFSKNVQKKRISKVLIHREKPDQVVKLSIAGGALFTNKIHPFFILGHGWLNVKNFEGDATIISADGSSYPVTAAQALSRSEILYNLEVEGHTYFVITNSDKSPVSVWVHNAVNKANNNPDL